MAALLGYIYVNGKNVAKLMEGNGVFTYDDQQIGTVDDKLNVYDPDGQFVCSLAPLSGSARAAGEAFERLLPKRG